MNILQRHDWLLNNRYVLGVFFLTVAGLKVVFLYTATTPPDLGGYQLSPQVFTGLLLLEATLGLLILTRLWVLATCAALILFIGFTGFAIAEELGLLHTKYCGCLGPVEINLHSRLLLSIGGLLSCVAILWKHFSLSPATPPLARDHLAKS